VGDDLAFDFGEPDLDLIEPGRVSGREVKPDSRMSLQELADRLRFVDGEIVEGTGRCCLSRNAVAG
jgi:hypothetical protein